MNRPNPGAMSQAGKSGRWPWVGGVVLLGFTYACVGILFAIPASPVKVWRLAAWVVSAFAYAAHIGYERFRLRNSPRLAALHVATAVALGAFGLAVAANIHSVRLGTANEHRRLLLLALVTWPVITALPAFLIALAVSWLLPRASSDA